MKAVGRPWPGHCQIKPQGRGHLRNTSGDGRKAVTLALVQQNGNIEQAFRLGVARRLDLLADRFNFIQKPLGKCSAPFRETKALIAACTGGSLTI